VRGLCTPAGSPAKPDESEAYREKKHGLRLAHLLYPNRRIAAAGSHRPARIQQPWLIGKNPIAAPEFSWIADRILGANHRSFPGRETSSIPKEAEPILVEPKQDPELRNARRLIVAFHGQTFVVDDRSMDRVSREQENQGEQPETSVPHTDILPAGAASISEYPSHGR
jgi:hypothetical protein